MQLNGYEESTERMRVACVCVKDCLCSQAEVVKPCNYLQ